MRAAAFRFDDYADNGLALAERMIALHERRLTALELRWTSEHLTDVVVRLTLAAMRELTQSVPRTSTRSWPLPPVRV